MPDISSGLVIFSLFRIPSRRSSHILLSSSSFVWERFGMYRTAGVIPFPIYSEGSAASAAARLRYAPR